MSNGTHEQNAGSEEYGAEQIQALEGIEGIRLRPAMYIGGTDLVGLHHLVFEVTDNVLDEYVNGHASTMTVTINGDGSVTVVDDGRVELGGGEDSALVGDPLRPDEGLVAEEQVDASQVGLRAQRAHRELGDGDAEEDRDRVHGDRKEDLPLSAQLGSRPIIAHVRARSWDKSSIRLYVPHLSL